MEIFDRPKVKIRKKLPTEAHAEYDLVLATILSIPESEIGQFANIDENRKELAIGFAMSIWACNTCYADGFNLSQRKFNYILNMGANCLNLLREYSYLGTNLADYLIEKKIIPHVDKD